MTRHPEIHHQWRQWKILLQRKLINLGLLRPPGPKEQDTAPDPEALQARQTLLHITDQRRPGFRR